MLTVAGIIILLAFGVLFPSKVQVILKGTYNLFFKNIANTPEGAAMIYDEAIEESEKKYSKAVDALQSVGGSLMTQKEYKEELLRNQATMERQCEALVRQGNRDQALLLANRIQDILMAIDNSTKNIDNLAKSVAEAKELVGMTENELSSLKQEKKLIIENLKLNSQMVKAYNSLDELRKDTNVQKLLGYVREGAKETKEQASGARIVHESKASTQLNNAIKTANSSNALDYLQKLEQKINGVSTTEDHGFEVKERITTKQKS